MNERVQDAQGGALAKMTEAVMVQKGICPEHHIPLTVARIETETMAFQVYCKASTECGWYDRIVTPEHRAYEALALRLDGEDCLAGGAYED
jgi:hypothetical protein